MPFLHYERKESGTKETHGVRKRSSSEGQFLKDKRARTQILPNMTFMLQIGSSSKLNSRLLQFI